MRYIKQVLVFPAEVSSSNAVNKKSQSDTPRMERYYKYKNNSQPGIQFCEQINGILEKKNIALFIEYIIAVWTVLWPSISTY